MNPLVVARSMKQNCDMITGNCKSSNLEELQTIGQNKLGDKTEIIYIGDPMCSWCWGISPHLISLRDHYRTVDVPLSIVVGGLRPGGGDPWNEEMKNFLRSHWKHVEELSGQPFSYDLMDRAEFNYDTEPACRAVVAARPLVGEKLLEFFEEVQRKFYVGSKDPSQEEFYKSICEKFGVDYEDFLTRFRDEGVRYETRNEFMLNRQWGVQGYPTVVLLHKDELFLIGHGYATFEQMKSQIEKTIDLEKNKSH